ncbi:hypothetical protein H0H93_010251 [Arthromyces matolae]|nr:hypothetical protein H0H93_010251 [Arthromyces matolae]
MNWQQDYPIGEFDGKRFPKKELEKYTSIIGMDLQKFEEYALEGRMDTGFAAMTRFYGGILHFEDDHDQFQSYLRDQPIESAATVSSLQLRKINRVHPKRAGAPLESPRLTIPSKLSKTEFYNTYKTRIAYNHGLELAPTDVHTSIMVAVDYAQARAVFAHIRRPTLRASDKDKWRSQTLETFLSLGLGSAVDGLTLSEVPCANHDSSRGQPCASTGILLCPKEKREPRFHPTNTHPSEIPAYDCLRISHNETERASVNRDFKLCFAASGDIRNLIQTVNGLPAGYRGRCDILLNDTDSITVNKKLVILYALLGAGPSIEESAEIALHLMYSSALPPGFAARG